MAFERTGGFNVANMEDCYRRFLAGIPDEERKAMFIEAGDHAVMPPTETHGEG